MAQIYKNFLTEDECQEIIDFTSSETLSEKVETITGALITRQYQSPRWGYIFTRIQLDELQKYVDRINDTFTEFSVTSIRTLLYPTGALMGRHNDAALPEEGDSDAGFIIQLTDPDMYKGGHLLMANEVMEMKPGDGVLYRYMTPHMVTKIKSGTRVICNVRLLKNR